MNLHSSNCSLNEPVQGVPACTLPIVHQRYKPLSGVYFCIVLLLFFVRGRNRKEINFLTEVCRKKSNHLLQPESTCCQRFTNLATQENPSYLAMVPPLNIFPAQNFRHPTPVPKHSHHRHIILTCLPNCTPIFPLMKGLMHALVESGHADLGFGALY